MAAEYPSAIPTMINPGTTQASPTHESIHLKENVEIVAIATELGTSPKGASASVALRLDAMTTSIGTVTTNLSSFVAGPASSANGAVAVMSGTSGKLITGSTVTGLLKATAGVIAAATTADYISTTMGTAAGEMIVYSASGAVSVVAAPGTTGYVMTADTTVAGKVAWKAATSGSSVVRATFGDSVLVAAATAGKFTITHNGGIAVPYTPLTSVSNSAGSIIIPDEINSLGANSFDVDLRSYVLGPQLACTIASGGTAVVTLAAHGMTEDQKLVFVTSVNLPAEITTGVIYYLATIGTGSFSLTASAASTALLAATGTCSGVKLQAYTSISGTWGCAYAV